MATYYNLLKDPVRLENCMGKRSLGEAFDLMQNEKDRQLLADILNQNEEVIFSTPPAEIERIERITHFLWLDDSWDEEEEEEMDEADRIVEESMRYNMNL